MVKLNAQCSAVLQNELPHKEKDPRSFVLPCIIGNTTVSNALADLGASISVMPFSMFKRLGLGNPRPVNMDNNLFPNYENPGDNRPSPNKSSSRNWNPVEEFQDSDDNLGIGIDDFVAIDDLWGNLDPVYLTNKLPLKPEFLSIGNRVNRYNPYNLQITCKIGFVNFNPYIDPNSPFNIMSRAAYKSIIKQELVYTRNNIVRKAKNLQVFIKRHSFLTDYIILENVNEFVEKRLVEVIFGKPFKKKIGLEEDISKGIIWFKIGDDKMIFNMPRAEKRLISRYREVEFEVSSTRFHVVARYVLWKPSRDFTRPLGPPSGLKGLLHTLNKTVIPTKGKRVPQAKEPREAKRKQKRTGKQSVVDLDEDDEDDEMASRRTITRWNNNEEILLAESWIEHSQDANIGKDQHDDIYWNLILSDFNSRTTAPPRTKYMVTGKWTRMHGDCQQFNGIYKHLNRKSGESDADLRASRRQTTGPEKAKIGSARGSTGGSTEGSQSESVSSLFSQDYSRKCDAAEKAYEAKREKELAIMQCKELEFLMIDPSALPATKRAIIERKQAEIMRKYPDA
ncbi:glutathione S-transferase T3-like protein [Tanacetum coccineum]